MSAMNRLMRAQEVALCVARKWWRPMCCVGVGLSIMNLAIAVFVGGIWLPLAKGQPLDFAALGNMATGIAALVASLTPFVAARAFEKHQGVADDA